MRILTLNLRFGGGVRIPALVEAIVAHDPDVAVLTEFRAGASGTRLLEALAAHGYTEALHAGPPPSTNSAVIVSRLALTPEATPRPHHRIVGARVGAIAIRGLYLPLLQPKVTFWADHLAPAVEAVRERPSLLIGDFNTGASDERQSTTRFFAEDRYLALLDTGWVDAVRRCRPGPPGFTWYSHRANGFTLDHALLSPSLAPRLETAALMHEPRLARITDHSGVVVEIGR